MRPLVFYIVCLTFFTNAKCKKTGECHQKVVLINNSGGNVINASRVQVNTGECSLAGGILKAGAEFVRPYRGCIEERENFTPFERYIVDTSMFNDPKIYYSCDSLEIKNKVLKHYILNLEDLKKVNFVVSYP